LLTRNVFESVMDAGKNLVVFGIYCDQQRTEPGIPSQSVDAWENEIAEEA